MLRKLFILFFLSYAFFSYSQDKRGTNLSLILSSNTDTVCPGEKVLITANIFNGTPPYQFKDADDDIVSPPLYIKVDSSITYKLLLIDAVGDTTSASVRINTYPSPEISIKASKLDGCQPLTVSFNEETQSSLPREYIWHFGNGDFSKDKNPVYTYIDAGVYKVSIEVREKHGYHTCVTKDTLLSEINVFEKPVAKFQAQPEIVDITNPEIFFENNSLKASNAIWIFDDGDTSDMYEPVHIFDSVGYYNVILIAQTEFGCKDTTAKLVRVKDITTFYMPEAFTPDEDDINDTYCPKFYGISDEGYKLEIYDRYGHIIFDTENPYECWKGDVYGRNIAPPGTYVYIVKYKSFEGVEYTKSGKILLFR